jgi:hypothetical protein
MTTTTPDIQTGFQPWIREPTRARSPEVDFGCWWTLSGNPREFPRWRVSWIEDTSELYAVELASHRPHRYIVLARFGGREAVEAAMYGWAESEMRLSDLPDRFGRINMQVCPDFAAQFQPMPEGKMSRARFAVTEMYDCDDGDYDGSGCEWNSGVDLLLGPDGNVWAKVGALDDVPDQPGSEDGEENEDERGDPPVFVAHRGSTVYHCWHDECLSENWYTTDPDDADIDRAGNAQFDVRDLPVAPPMGDDRRADHRGRIMAAIDAGLITEDGYADPDDLAEEAK